MDQHFTQMAQDNWGTPPEIVDRVHAFYGAPDLDPCSDAQRNTLIQAKRWLGAGNADPVIGIPKAWGEAKTLFINPPGGSFGKNTYASLFWAFAVMHLINTCPSDGELIWVAYNINQLQTLQRVDPATMAACLVCVPGARVKYLDPSGVAQGGTPSASAILCLSGREDAPERFLKVFNKEWGTVWFPSHVAGGAQ
jgi:hypothetical protein